MGTIIHPISQVKEVYTVSLGILTKVVQPVDLEIDLWKPGHIRVYFCLVSILFCGLHSGGKTGWFVARVRP